MWQWFKNWIAKYDRWCESLGLTPENKRSCVPHKKDPAHDD
ncbi:hypothetical protein JCM19233_1640 [Vibrio astriarenae]|nr:hypothetical protein JCM19233_1640 [Vibrio sp. C7]